MFKQDNSVLPRFPFILTVQCQTRLGFNIILCFAVSIYSIILKIGK